MNDKATLYLGDVPNPEIKGTNLVGEFRAGHENFTNVSADYNIFLERLELLMCEYRIIKIDICWDVFKFIDKDKENDANT